MLIYNVTIKVDAQIVKDWLHWMKNDHLPDMMSTGLFCDYRMCKLLEQDESDGFTYVVQFHTDSAENYESYVNEHANRMQQKGPAKFGDKMIAFRTLMEIID